MHNLPPGRISGFAASGDGAEMALTMYSLDKNYRRLYSVNPRTGECAFQDLNLAASAHAGLAFSPDGLYLAVGGGAKEERFLRHWPQMDKFA